MKVLQYLFKGNSVKMGWNEINEEVAKREADNGEYTLEEDEQFEPEVSETTEAVLNTLLGVAE